MRISCAPGSCGCSASSDPTRSERELSAELESHLQLHIDDNIRAGMTPQEARRRALIALGGVEGTKEAYRDRRGLPAFESLVRDLRYGIRTLMKSPGFALAGVLILGLGIGVNSAIFTVVNAVVLKPLPFADADRIMRLWHTPPPTLFTTPIFALSPANFIDWEAQNQVVRADGDLPRRPADADRPGRAGRGDRPSAPRRIFCRSSACRRRSVAASREDDDRAGGAAHGAAERRVLPVALRRRSVDRSARPSLLNRVPHTVIGVVPPIAVVHRSRAGVGAAGVDRGGSRRSATTTTTAASPS